MVIPSEAFSKGIIKGLKPYAKEYSKEIKNVTTKEEQKQIGISKVSKKKKSKDTRMKRIEKILSKRLPSKSVVKPSRVTVRIPEYKAPSILNDPNRFFKDEYEETKKELFFK